MHGFRGYLLQFINLATGDTYKLPNTLFYTDSWTITPDQVTDVDSQRDANNDLHRNVPGNVKSKIEFNTKDGMTLSEKVAMQTGMKTGLVDAKERKYYCRYWNDQENVYKDGYFYMPDVQYKIKHITEEDANSTMEYSPIRFSLIEY